jgi:hypothetical protein
MVAAHDGASDTLHRAGAADFACDLRKLGI